MPKLDHKLTHWLNHEVYPHLTHEAVFGDLTGFTKAQFGESWYADCPVCHRLATFYMLSHRQVGQCNSCGRVVGWFGYIRRRYGSDQAAITAIAELAGVNTRPEP
jgi:hypothetical protein